MKKIICIIVFFSLISCNISKDECKNNDLWYFEILDYGTIVNTCNYMGKLKQSMYNDNALYVPSFYFLMPNFT